MKRRPLIAGNWKMNGSQAANAALASEIAVAAGTHAAELLVCPPAVYIGTVGAALAGSAVQLGAQSLAEQTQPGAFTGEVCGAMLVDVGCRYVIVGHSERRILFGENDAIVAKKVAAALAAGLTPILCVGETLVERDNGLEGAVLRRQLHAVFDACSPAQLAELVIAYEPVWAIGTGRTASPAHAQAVHALIRGEIAVRDAKIADSTRILYGGSVKPDNAAALFSEPDVDGGLIGGASLKSAEFLAIAAAA